MLLECSETQQSLVVESGLHRLDLAVNVFGKLSGAQNLQAALPFCSLNAGTLVSKLCSVHFAKLIVVASSLHYAMLYCGALTLSTPQASQCV